MKRLFMLVVCCVVTCMIVTVVPSYALTGEVNSECPYKELEDVVSLQQGGNLVIDGTTNPLFWEFADESQAYLQIGDKYQSVLMNLKDKYNLKEFGKSSWQSYKDAFENTYDIFSDKLDDTSKVLDEFFGVCERSEYNEMARSIARKSNYDVTEFIGYLSYTSPIFKKDRALIQSKLNASTKSTMIKSMNVKVYAASASTISKRTAYAKKYAANHNRNYKYYNADCTNFASQILHAGGEPTNSSWKPYTRNWVNANAFACYWYMKNGEKNGYSSFKSISGAVRAGDFIAVDFENDIGTYDHVGYVVSQGPKTSAGYHDITIAQHTHDYCEKVSSTKNGWEHKTGTFIRLRMN